MRKHNIFFSLQSISPRNYKGQWEFCSCLPISFTDFIPSTKFRFSAQHQEHTRIGYKQNFSKIIPQLTSIFSKQKVSVFADDKCNSIAQNPEADKTEDKVKIWLNKNRFVFIYKAYPVLLYVWSILTAFCLPSPCFRSGLHIQPTSSINAPFIVCVTHRNPTKHTRVGNEWPWKLKLKFYHIKMCVWRNM